MSSRAYKIRPLDVFTPHPTLHLEGSALSSAHPSRSNSRTNSSRAGWRFREPLANKDANTSHRARVDDLADELDAKGLREAMERDQRRRERRRREYEEKLQAKLEKRAAEQQRFDVDDSENEHGFERGETSAAAQHRENQTPLSWFNANPSVDDVRDGADDGFVRPEVHTPVSIDSSVEEDYAEAAREQHREDKVPEVVVEPPQPSRAKTSSWTAFIRRATAARIRKDNANRGIPNRESTNSTGSATEESGIKKPQQPTPSGTYLDVEDIRHREGQTPGRHVSKEVVMAMNALESGHIHEKGYEDELRDSVRDLEVQVSSSS